MAYNQIEKQNKKQHLFQNGTKRRLLTSRNKQKQKCQKHRRACCRQPISIYTPNTAPYIYDTFFNMMTPKWIKSVVFKFCLCSQFPSSQYFFGWYCFFFLGLCMMWKRPLFLFILSIFFFKFLASILESSIACCWYEKNQSLSYYVVWPASVALSQSKLCMYVFVIFFLVFFPHFRFS